MTGTHAHDARLRLAELWPAMTWRNTGDLPRTIVVVSSIDLDLPDRWLPVVPAYEERFLCYLLALSSPGTRVVYVTSMPILPRLIDYWLGLVPGLDTPETRQRLTLIPVVDARQVPLTHKILDHPGVMARIRTAVHDPRLAVVMPYMVTAAEVELGRQLDIPVYGPDPSLARWGTKIGSREAFAAVGLPIPPGVTGVRTVDDVCVAIAELATAVRDLSAVIVKADTGISGVGNGTIRLTPDRALRDCVESVVLEEPGLTAEAFFDRLAGEGGVVEAFLVAAQVRSPSVQLRITPTGAVDVVSTHEQIMGGPHGLSYEGCKMPASSEYAALIAAHAIRVGEHLAAEGVIGRLAIDFLALRDGASWTVHGLEINLRNGGTTHPLSTLQALTNGGYDAITGQYSSEGGTEKFYRATDHMERDAYRRLTTDDFLDLMPARGLSWDQDTETGVVFHLASAIAGMGVVGVTAVGDSPEQAELLFAGTRRALDEESALMTNGPDPTRGSGPSFGVAPRVTDPR